MKYADYFTSIPTLETPHLTLRAFTLEDMAPYRAWLETEAVQQYLGGVQAPQDEAACGRWLANINGRLLKGKVVITWCIEEKETGAAIGRIDLGGFDRRTMAELSYYLDSAVWGRGLGTEAVAAVTAFGLEALRLHRIEAKVMPENTGSLRVLEKNGYEREGLLRKTRFGKAFHDAVMLSVIREENLEEKRFA